MKRQPLQYRLNVVGGSLIIFLVLRTYRTPFITRLAHSFGMLMILYTIMTVACCVAPVAFIENMCDFHPRLLEKKAVKSGDIAIVGAAMLCFILLAVLNQMALMPVKKLGIDIPETQLMPVSGFLNILLYFICIVVAPAIFEELFLRGTVMNLLKPDGTRFAVIVSAFVFMCLHTTVENFIAIFGAGLALACIYAYTGNIYVCMLLHFANNTYSFIMMYMQQKVDGVNLIGFAAFVILIILVWGIYSFILLIKNGVNPLRVMRLKEKNTPFVQIFKSPVMVLGVAACLFGGLSRFYTAITSGG